MVESTFYFVRNELNGKLYVGATTMKPGRRWTLHKYNAKINHSTLLQKAIVKYGKENFTFNIIGKAKLENLDAMYQIESKLIEKYNSFRFGYNQTIGGAGCKCAIVSDSTKLKMSMARKGKPCPWSPDRVHHFLGKKHKEESLKKMSKALKGKYISGETKPESWSKNQSRGQERIYLIYDLKTNESTEVKGLKRFLEKNSIPWSTGAMAINTGKAVRKRYIINRISPKKGDRLNV